MNSVKKCAPRSLTPQLLIALLVSIVGIEGAVGAQEVAEETEEKVIRGISYVGITVSDLDAATDYYSQSADLEEVARDRLTGLDFIEDVTGDANVVLDTRLLESTNAQLRFMQVLDADGKTKTAPDWIAVPVNGPGMAHICYRSDSKNETYQKFVKRGATLLGSPEMVELSTRFPVHYAYNLDADGIMYEVEHIDIDRMPAAKPPTGFYNLRHISLASPDIDQAVAFYSKLLGVPSPRRLGGEEGLSGEPFDQVSGLAGTRLQMAWFQVGNLELEVVEYLSHPPGPAKTRPLEAPGYNMIVFDVSSLDGARKLLTGAGGDVVSEKQAMDGGEIFFGRDPDENLLGFFVPAADSLFATSRFDLSNRR